MNPDQDLLKRVRRGDASAFESLYDRHSPTMYAVALRILGQEDRACAALEATFLALWEGRVTYAPASAVPLPGSYVWRVIMPWLYAPPVFPFAPTRRPLRAS